MTCSLSSRSNGMKISWFKREVPGLTSLLVHVRDCRAIRHTVVPGEFIPHYLEKSRTGTPTNPNTSFSQVAQKLVGRFKQASLLRISRSQGQPNHFRELLRVPSDRNRPSIGPHPVGKWNETTDRLPIWFSVVSGQVKNTWESAANRYRNC